MLSTRAHCYRPLALALSVSRLANLYSAIYHYIVSRRGRLQRHFTQLDVPHLLRRHMHPRADSHEPGRNLLGPELCVRRAANLHAERRQMPRPHHTQLWNARDEKRLLHAHDLEHHYAKRVNQ